MPGSPTILLLLYGKKRVIHLTAPFIKTDKYLLKQAKIRRSAKVATVMCVGDCETGGDQEVDCSSGFGNCVVGRD